MTEMFKLFKLHFGSLLLQEASHTCQKTEHVLPEPRPIRLVCE